jgi:sporulation protein YqfC
VPAAERSRWLRLKRRLAETLDVPAELLLDLPRVTLLGNLQLEVENHRGILAFSESRLVIGVARGEVEVRGRGLVVARASKTAATVRGEIGELILRPGAPGPT